MDAPRLSKLAKENDLQTWGGLTLSVILTASKEDVGKEALGQRSVWKARSVEPEQGSDAAAKMFHYIVSLYNHGSSCGE
jgi:hypothetical protein